METVLQIISSVYAVMNVSPLELSIQDVEQELNDVVRRKLHDLKFSSRESCTEETDCSLTLEEYIDYSISFLGKSKTELDPIYLKYSEKLLTAGNVGWSSANVVPLRAFEQYADQPEVFVAFYGAKASHRVKINRSDEWIAAKNWRIVLARPMEQFLVVTSQQVPLPDDFIPMVRVETIINCVPRVRSKSKDWREWRADNLPLLIDKRANWLGAWQEYLERTLESEEQIMIPYNDFRRTGA